MITSQLANQIGRAIAADDLPVLAMLILTHPSHVALAPLTLKRVGAAVFQNPALPLSKPLQSVLRTMGAALLAYELDNDDAHGNDEDVEDVAGLQELERRVA